MKISKITSMLVALICFNTLFAATPLLNPKYYGMESASEGQSTEKNGWFFQKFGDNNETSFYSFSQEQANVGGIYSMKFHIDDITNSLIPTNIQVSCGLADSPDSSKLNLEAGQYNLTFNIFLGQDAPRAIQFWVKPNGVNTMILGFKAPLSNVERNKWVTITAIEVKSGSSILTSPMLDNNLSIVVPKSTINASGQTTCSAYIDDINLFIEGTTAIPENKTINNSIIFNSSNKTLTIKSEKNSNIRILNTLGSLVKTFKNNTGNLNISTSSFSCGIYFVEISKNGDKSVNKIIL